MNKVGKGPLPNTQIIRHIRSWRVFARFGGLIAIGSSVVGRQISGGKENGKETRWQKAREEGSFDGAEAQVRALPRGPLASAELPRGFAVRVQKADRRGRLRRAALAEVLSS